jgi:UDP-glucose 4-epimerase
MKERVLITGASGFVGYHLILEALKNNLEVFAAVRKTSLINHLKHLDIQYTYLEFTDVSALKSDIEEKQYQYIIHAAGVTRARTAEEYNLINAGYTYNLASAAATAGSYFKKFVFISSLAGIGPIDSLNGIINEETLPHPITAYGRSKLLAEDKLKTIPNLNYTILRPTAVYGPRDKDIFIFLKQVARGIEPYIGKIQQKLSFIYVSDLATAAIKALHTGDNKIYNIADGNTYDRYELANITRNILKVRTIKFHIPVNFVKMIAIISEKVSSLSSNAPVLNTEKLNELKAVNWSCAIECAKNDLFFYPQYDLQAGLTEAFSWYKANKWL